jgi:mlo protein
MGSKFKKSVVSENVRESLHKWCKRVRHKTQHARSLSVSSLDFTVDEFEETLTVGTLTRTASTTSLDDLGETAADAAVTDELLSDKIYS